jgi:hypothetical protein
MYRFLAVAFEKTDMVLIDARKLAIEHLGILNPPKYLSRLMQTLEPAFDQLIRIGVLGSYHVVNSDRWELALHRSKTYVPERKSLLLQDPAATLEMSRGRIQKVLETAGIAEAARYADAAETQEQLYQLERAAGLLHATVDQGVFAHVALHLVKRALEAETNEECVEQLDWLEIAVETCRQKKQAGQALKNPGGLLVTIAKDGAGRARIVPDEAVAMARQRFRQREQLVWSQYRQAEQRAMVLEYEEYREQTGNAAFAVLPEAALQTLRREKAEILKQQGRFEKMDARGREREIDEMIRQELARKEAPPFEKWYMRRRARQAVLPFDGVMAATAS